ncbi:MAG: exonuclease SbcCD subunit D [Saprospiraceae bacterium]|nr:exonuclease SbcCD subunit D [Saprospiraceae bacterium]
MKDNQLKCSISLPSGNQKPDKSYFSGSMPKITILFFADSHLGFDYPISKTSKANRRGSDFFRNYEFILQTAKEREVDLVIHGGDLFDSSEVHPRIVNKAYDMLFEFVDVGIPLVLVPGNHDRSTLPSGLFLQHANLHIFYEPCIFRLNLKNLPFNICGFPFIRRIGNEFNNLKKHLEGQIPAGGTSILCMHQAVQGATVGPSDYTFRPGPEVIRIKDLDGPYQVYLSGHIHRHQILKAGNDIRTGKPVPFIYPGSIERTSFAERGEEKGFTYLEFEQEETTPNIVFQKLPSRSMHLLKIENEEIDQSLLKESIRQRISKIDPNAILQIESPTEYISKMLKELQKKDIPQTMHVQLRHRWLVKDNRA